MREKSGLGSQITEWFRQRLDRTPQEPISVEIEEDFKAGLLDPAEDEYFYPDNFISENNYIYQDQKIPEVFDNVVVDLAKDIEDYLNTYASLPLLPFGAVEENREEWVQAFSKDLLANHGEWCRKEIYEAMTPLKNMESPEIKEIAQKLLVRIEQLELNSRENKDMVADSQQWGMQNSETENEANSLKNEMEVQPGMTLNEKRLSDAFVGTNDSNMVIEEREYDYPENFVSDSSPGVEEISHIDNSNIIAGQRNSEECLANKLLKQLDKYQDNLMIATYLAEYLQDDNEKMVEINPRILSYPFSSLGGEGCSYAKAAMDVRQFQSVFGAVNMKYYDTHDVFIQNQNGELSGFLMDKESKDIVCESSLDNVSQESLAACAHAIKFMNIYANWDMTSVVSVGKPIDSANVEYSLKEGMSDYFTKPNQNLIMSVSQGPLCDKEYFRILDEDKRMDIPSIQKTVLNLYEEHDVRGVLAGIAGLSGVKVNDPYNILGRDIYMSQDEIRNQIISKACISFPSDRMINSMDSLNRAVGFNCSMEDVKKLAKGEAPEGSSLKNVPHETKGLATGIENDLNTTEKTMESNIPSDWINEDYVSIGCGWE